MAATKSLTADSPRRQRIFISLSSASVNVFDFFGGIPYPEELIGRRDVSDPGLTSL
jgi:hypothetical protein